MDGGGLLSPISGRFGSKRGGGGARGKGGVGLGMAASTSAVPGGPAGW